MLTNNCIGDDDNDDDDVDLWFYLLVIAEMQHVWLTAYIWNIMSSNVARYSLELLV